jgi:hypothetical protein
MSPKNSVKDKVHEEIDLLPDDSVESVYQIIHALRLELAKTKKAFSKKFLQTFGSWQDKRSAEQIAEDIYNSRCFLQKNLQW